MEVQPDGVAAGAGDKVGDHSAQDVCQDRLEHGGRQQLLGEAPQAQLGRVLRGQQRWWPVTKGVLFLHASTMSSAASPC